MKIGSIQMLRFSLGNFDGCNRHIANDARHGSRIVPTFWIAVTLTVFAPTWALGQTVAPSGLLKVAVSHGIGLELSADIIEGFVRQRGARAKLHWSKPQQDTYLVHLSGENAFNVLTIKMQLVPHKEVEVRIAAGEFHFGLSTRNARSGLNALLFGISTIEIAADKNSELTSVELSSANRTSQRVRHVYGTERTREILRGLRSSPIELRRFLGRTKFLQYEAEVWDKLRETPNAVALVASIPNHIGRVSAIPIGECGRRFHPTQDGVMTGEYPLNYGLYFYGSSKFQNQVGKEFKAYLAEANFIRHLRSNKVMDPTGLHVTPQNDRNLLWLKALVDKLAEDDPIVALYANAIKNAGRVSRFIYFSSGKATLTEISRATIRSIAQELRGQSFRRLIIAGFSDATGTAENNEELSKRRSSNAADALQATRLTHSGNMLSFGLASRLGVRCNNRTEGSQWNRRVEVWIER